MTRADLHELVYAHRDEGLLYVHRDLGPGFTHNPSPDCPCRPHVIEPSDTRPTEEILLEIAALERRGDA